MMKKKMLPDCQIAELCTQSCLSVSVLNCCLVLLHPQMSLGMCKDVCVCVCVCVCVVSSWGWSPLPTFQISIWETKVLVSTIKRHGRCAFLHFPPNFFFKSNLIESHLCGCMEEADGPAGDEFKLCLLAFHLVLFSTVFFFFLV